MNKQSSCLIRDLTNGCFSLVLISAIICPLKSVASPACENFDGQPTVAKNSVQCRFKTVINEQNGQPLLQVTKGIVKEVQISSDLQIPISLSGLLKIFTETTLSIPEQAIDVSVAMGPISNVPVLRASLLIRPTISLTGDTVCNVQAVSASINSSQFNSDLPDSIDRLLLERINQSNELVSGLVGGANELISKSRPSFCQQ
jgi:hypothetical protein